MKTVNVAVGVIFKQQQILLSLRHQAQHQGGKWEFPGGKVEPEETVLEALARELKEELLIDIDVSSCKALTRIEHDYVDKRVCLHVYTIERFTGEAQGAEQQEIRWVMAKNLSDYTFPEANLAILQAIGRLETNQS
ncbi:MULTISPECIES: 8-oxo-dGTP diphosphatase MutT [unclassified Agarivorans]|uniref:8-oxo-dGTP diphosphatase MutT n=1 Tax=unclassified Agarivorans TaxID=2636026 RepID=UPI003D7D60BD